MKRIIASATKRLGIAWTSGRTFAASAHERLTKWWPKARHALRSRLARLGAWIIVHRVVILGTILILSAGGIVLYGLPKRLPRSTEFDQAIGFAAPGTPPDFGRGWIVDLDIRPPTGWSCRGDTRVLAIVQGSREFWDDHPKSLRGDARVGLGIAGLRVRNVRAGYLTDLRDIEAARSRGTAPLFAEQLTTATEVHLGYGAIAVDVPDWGRTRAPLLIAFDSPDLASRRDPSSCWVTTPGVVGGRSQVAQSWAKFVLGISNAPTPESILNGSYDARPYDSVGRTTIVNDDGRLPEMAQPQPTYVTADGPVWTCRSAELPLGLKENDHVSQTDAGPFVRHLNEPSRPVPLATQYGRDLRAGDCGAVAAVPSRHPILSSTSLGFLSGVLLTFGASLLLLPLSTRTDESAKDPATEPGRAPTRN